MTPRQALAFTCILPQTRSPIPQRHHLPHPGSPCDAGHKALLSALQEHDPGAGLFSLASFHLYVTFFNPRMFIGFDILDKALFQVL